MYVSNGVAINSQYGDLLLWFELLQEAKSKDWKGIILITDDAKEDWWWIVESEARKLSDKTELVEEIRREGGVSQFYMYNSERYLHYAQEFLGAEVKAESIAQVREVRELQSLEASLRYPGVT